MTWKLRSIRVPANRVTNQNKATCNACSWRAFFRQNWKVFLLENWTYLHRPWTWSKSWDYRRILTKIWFPRNTSCQCMKWKVFQIEKIKINFTHQYRLVYRWMVKWAGQWCRVSLYIHHIRHSGRSLEQGRGNIISSSLESSVKPILSSSWQLHLVCKKQDS